MKTSRLILGALAMTLAFTACKKDDDVVDPHDDHDHNHEGARAPMGPIFIRKIYPNLRKHLISCMCLAELHEF